MLVTIEGPDFAGKTTLVEGLVKHYKQHFPGQTSSIREPGHTGDGKRIREVIMGSPSMEPIPRMFLFLADRAMTHNAIKDYAYLPDRLVFSDRGLLSGAVYAVVEGAASEMQMGMFNAFALEDSEPSLIIVLTLEQDTIEQRMRMRSASDGNFIDLRPVSFQMEAQKKMRDIASHSYVSVFIDANTSRDKLLQNAIYKVDQLIAGKLNNSRR